MGFWSYYKRVLIQIVSDCTKQVAWTSVAALIAFGAAYLQVRYYSQPAAPAWARAVTTVAVTVFVFLLYVLYYAVRAPWGLYRQASQSHAVTLEECRSACNEELDDLKRSTSAAIAILERENAELKDKFVNPKLECKIGEYEVREVVSPDIIRGGSLFNDMRILAGISDMDTILTLAVTISNAHRIDTSATCDLKIVDRGRQEHFGTRESVPEKLNYSLLDLTALIKYAAPRSGVARFKFAHKSKDQLAGGRLILVVTDGIGNVSTDEKQL
jgi:hypothetical protein